MAAGGAFVAFGSLRATGRFDWMGAVLPLALCGSMHLVDASYRRAFVPHVGPTNHPPSEAAPATVAPYRPIGAEAMAR